MIVGLNREQRLRVVLARRACVHVLVGRGQARTSAQGGRSTGGHVEASTGTVGAGLGFWLRAGHSDPSAGVWLADRCTHERRYGNALLTGQRLQPDLAPVASPLSHPCGGAVVAATLSDLCALYARRHIALSGAGAWPRGRREVWPLPKASPWRGPRRRSHDRRQSALELGKGMGIGMPARGGRRRLMWGDQRRSCAWPCWSGG